MPPPLGFAACIGAGVDVDAAGAGVLADVDTGRDGGALLGAAAGARRAPIPPNFYKTF